MLRLSVSLGLTGSGLGFVDAFVMYKELVI